MNNITDAYLLTQKDLHQNPNYGIASISHAPNIKKIMTESGFRSLSDYGAGKQNLKKALNDLNFFNFDYFPYDPVFPEYGKPKSSELVCCIDVMEHVEDVFVESVLDEIKSITQKLCYFSIATVPSKKFLNDGRNAHLIQQPPRWWVIKLCKRFDLQFFKITKSGFIAICHSLK